MTDSRDVREGGSWSHAQRLKNAVIYLAVRLALWVADRVPERWLLSAGRVSGAVVYHLHRSARRTAEINLRACLPDMPIADLARRSFERAGENLARCLLLRRPSFTLEGRVRFEPRSLALFESALADRRGVVFVSAHHGPFEWLAAAVAAVGWEPAVVVRESYDPRLDACVDAHRRLRGIEVIHRGRPGAALRIARALRAGRPVGMLPDLGGRVPCEEVTFLGVRTVFPAGPARIAQRAGARMLVGTLQPAGEAGVFSVVIEEVPVGQPARSAAPANLDVGQRSVAPANEPEAASAMTQRVATVLDRAILGSREEWVWMARSTSALRHD